MDHPHPLRGPLFDQFAMTAEGAKAGLGVALLPSFLVELELVDGQLIGLDAQPLCETGAYYLVIPLGRRQERAIAEFAEWLAAEALAAPSFKAMHKARRVVSPDVV